MGFLLVTTSITSPLDNLDSNGTSPGSGLPNTIISNVNGAPSGQEWASSNRQMNGLAFAVVTLGYNQDAGTTQLQPITFKCSHYLNGTGVAKPGDVWYDYITNVNYGGAVDTTLVDSASATVLNNYSDQLITYTPDGGGTATQARYRINGVFDTGTSVLENIENLLTCLDIDF